MKYFQTKYLSKELLREMLIEKFSWLFHSAKSLVNIPSNNLIAAY